MAHVRFVARVLRERGAWPELVRGWAESDERGDADGAWRMGWVLLDQGDRAGSERAFGRAAQRGNLSALFKVCGERARAGLDATALQTEYERASRRRQEADQLADQRGDADAAYRIGFDLVARSSVLETELSAIPDISSRRKYKRWQAVAREKRDQARELRRSGEAALRRAAERGSADAAAKLGALEHEGYPSNDSDQQQNERALPWYRLADELGHPAGSWWLGHILAARGDHDEAQAAYRRAEIRGHPLAASSLASLLSRRTPLDRQALEAAYRRVTEIDYDPNGWVKLAGLLQQRDDLDGAEAAYQRAVERGAREAAFALRRLREQRATKPSFT